MISLPIAAVNRRGAEEWAKLPDTSTIPTKTEMNRKTILVLVSFKMQYLTGKQTRVFL